MVWTLAVTLSRALRMPADYAEAQWLLDYRFGFVKRGLVGELFTWVRTWFDLAVSEQLILNASITTLVAFCLLLLYIAWRILRAHDWSAAATTLLLVFFSSPFIVMSANVIGYYDNIVIALGIVSLMLMKQGRLWLAALVQVAAMLVHENAALVVFPSFLLLACWQALETGSRYTRGQWFLLVSPALVFVSILLWQDILLPKDVLTRQVQYLSQYPFINNGLESPVPQYLGKSFSDYIALQSRFFLNIITAPELIILVAPFLLVLCVFVIQTAGRRLLPLQLLMLLCVVAAPQLMHLAAWDGARISTFSIVCAVMAVYAFTGNGYRKHSSLLITVFGLMALIVNACMDVQVMGDTEHHSKAMRLLLYVPAAIVILALDGIAASSPKPAAGRLQSSAG